MGRSRDKATGFDSNDPSVVVRMGRFRLTGLPHSPGPEGLDHAQPAAITAMATIYNVAG